MTSTKSINMTPVHKLDTKVMEVNEAMRQTTLSKEPNPFEQSFGSSELIKKIKTEEEKPNNELLNLPSINQLNRNKIDQEEGPIKLSPMILDPKNYEGSGPYSIHHTARFGNVLHPPLRENFAQTLPTNPLNRNTQRIVPPQITTYPQAIMPMNQINASSLVNNSYLYDVNKFVEPSSVTSIDSTYIKPQIPVQVPIPIGIGIPGYTNKMMPMPPPPLPKPVKKPAGGRKRLPTEGMSEKKIDFLARNRKAALKCRERKKREIRGLEERTHYLEYTNNILANEVAILKQEALKLKSLIVNHASCPIAQANGIHGEATLPKSLDAILKTEQ